MFCGKCGNKIEATDKFCPFCGAPAEKPKTIEEVNQEAAAPAPAPVSRGAGGYAVRPESPKKAKKQLSKREKIIIGCCAGLVLLVGIGAVLALTLGRNSNKPVGNRTVDNSTPVPTEENEVHVTEQPPATEAPKEPATSRPIDNSEHESDGFIYRICNDGTAEITGYTDNDSYISVPSSIDGYEVSSFGASAFENCTSMTSIIIWPDITNIGESAFKGCTALTSISVPSSITEINASVFENCTSLESIALWGDVVSIGNAAFKNCTALTSISISSYNKSIGESAFENCTALENVFFWGGGVIGRKAFKNCTSLTDVSIPSEITEIKDYAFEGCTALESVTVWNDDTIIAENAFENCPKLDEIEIW